MTSKRRTQISTILTIYQPLGMGEAFTTVIYRCQFSTTHKYLNRHFPLHTEPCLLFPQISIINFLHRVIFFQNHAAFLFRYKFRSSQTTIFRQSASLFGHYTGLCENRPDKKQKGHYLDRDSDPFVKKTRDLLPLPHGKEIA